MRCSVYSYQSSNKKNYILYYSKIFTRGGKETKIYYLLEEGKKPANKLYDHYMAKSLPDEYEIKEIGKNKVPLVYKVRNGRD